MRDKLKRAMQIPGLPNLPTDNYYKFKALAGIWLVAGTLSAIAIGFFQFEREIFDTKARLADLKTERDVLAQEDRREDARLETQTAATRTLEALKTEIMRVRAILISTCASWQARRVVSTLLESRWTRRGGKSRASNLSKGGLMNC